MKYRTIQQELKDLRDNKGFKLQCRLNDKMEVLQAEFNRIADIKTDMDSVEESNVIVTHHFKGCPELTTNCGNVSISEAIAFIDRNYPGSLIDDISKHEVKEVKPTYIDETYRANGTLSTFHLDYCLPNDGTEQPYTFTANAYGIEQARAAIRKERPGLMYLGCKRVEPIETGRAVDIGRVIHDTDDDTSNHTFVKFTLGDTEYVYNCGNVEYPEAIDFVERNYPGSIITEIDGKPYNSATGRITAYPDNHISVKDGERFTVDSVKEVLILEGFTVTTEEDMVFIKEFLGFLVVKESEVICSSDALTESVIPNILRVAGYCLKSKDWNKDEVRYTLYSFNKSKRIYEFDSEYPSLEKAREGAERIKGISGGTDIRQEIFDYEKDDWTCIEHFFN